MAKIILDDEAKITALAELESSLGWVVIKDFLEDNIEELSKSILGDINDEIPEREKKLLVLKRYYQQKLLDIPKQLSKYIMDSKSTTQPVEFDPFDLPSTKPE